jgi:hypothetical protein
MSYFEFKLPPGQEYQPKLAKLKQELDRWCSLHNMRQEQRPYELYELDARRVGIKWIETHDRNYFLQEWRPIDPWLQFVVRPGRLERWASMSWRYREISELYQPGY